MSAFGWPQWVVLVAMILSAANSVFKIARDRSNGSGMATAVVLITLALTGVYAGVLHAGGFW